MPGRIKESKILTKKWAEGAEPINVMDYDSFHIKNSRINREKYLRYKLSMKIYGKMLPKQDTKNYHSEDMQNLSATATDKPVHIPTHISTREICHDDAEINAFNKPIKIAVVVPKYGLMGGAENFVYQLTERLAQFEKIEIHVFANKWKKGSSPICFHKIRTISFPRFLEPVSFAINVFLKTRGRYDIIHSHDRIFFMDIFTFHGIPHVTWIKKIRKKKWLKLSDMVIAWIERKGMLNQGLKKILPVSSIAADEMQKMYGLPEERIKIMHPGISHDFFKNHDKREARVRIRKKFGFSDSDILILFVGMNFEIKNLDLVMEAVAQCNKKGENSFKLMVVGKGNRAKYTKKAKQLKIFNQMAFAGATSFVQDFYLASDIFIMPSKYDTFGMVVLEAMLAGLPVIISSTVGAKDLVNRSNGFIISSESDPVIVSDILFKLKNNTLRQKMGEKARITSLSCSWDAMAEEIYSLYLNLMVF